MKRSAAAWFLIFVSICGLPLSRSLAQSQASPYLTGTRYDAMRRVTGIIRPDPDGSGPLHYAAIRNSYDAAGRLIKVEKGELSDWQSEYVNPNAWTGFTVFQIDDITYDALDRKLTERLSGRTGSTDTAYALAQYSYDVVGRLECTAIRMNPAAFAALPASACTLGAEGSNGPDRITRSIYDAAGQLLQTRKAVGTAIEIADATYSYTADGLKEYVVDASGNRAQMVYDGFDELQRWYFPSPARPGNYDDSTPANALSTAGAVNTSDYEQYAYDANGNRTSLRKRDGRVFTFSYDALNRMVSKVVPDGCAPNQAGPCPGADRTRDVYYGYDTSGRQLYARFDSPTGSDAVVNTYDGFGELATSTTSMDGVSRTLSFMYDPDGNRTRVTHPDGTWFTYVYDGLDREGQLFEQNGSLMTAWTYNPQGLKASAFGGGQTFGYDEVGRLKSEAISFGRPTDVAWTFGYNPADQMVSRTQSNDAYSWTGAVNVTRNYAVNGLNQYTNAGSATFTYDANGNLLSDGTNSYAYDAENRLTLALSPSPQRVMYYDPLGRLWLVAGGAAGTTQFLYDRDDLVAEYGGSGNLLRRYVHGNGEDTPAIWYEGAGLGAIRYMFADRQGSIVLAFDVNRNQVALNTYDEYGIPGAGNVGRFQYTGQTWLPELGMYYYKARIYSPTLGRFLQTDPIGYQDQINLYAYVANDPVNHADPSGESITEIGFLIYDVASAANHIAHGASAGEIINDAANIALDIEPVPGLREVKGAVEVGRAVEHGVEAVRAERAAAHGLPRPGTGPGRVPRAERDPQRTFSPADRAAKREAQGGQCANGCGTRIDASNSHGHHIERHADGGRTDSANHAEVCINCHKELHRPE